MKRLLTAAPIAALALALTACGSHAAQATSTNSGGQALNVSITPSAQPSASAGPGTSLVITTSRGAKPTVDPSQIAPAVLNAYPKADFGAVGCATEAIEASGNASQFIASPAAYLASSPIVKSCGLDKPRVNAGGLPGVPASH